MCPAAKSRAGPLTEEFKKFLYSMWNRQDDVVSPRDLFDQITRKWSQFRGWRQQDSQELMRFLFDGIKDEELNVRIICPQFIMFNLVRNYVSCDNKISLIY